MCGRYHLYNLAEFYERFKVVLGREKLEPRYNIAPGQQVPAIIDDNGQRKLAFYRWGLIPHWSKDAAGKSGYINARVETVAQKPSFKGLLAGHRCLVPASGYYEWKKDGPDKKPYSIHPKDLSLFSFAGLWDSWYCRDKKEFFQTLTIITTVSTGLAARLHDRMPVILDKAGEEAWLDPHLPEPGLILETKPSYHNELLACHPVSRQVNSPKNDTPKCVAPLAVNHADNMLR